MSNLFDTEFLLIPGLKSLPWIGVDYLNNPRENKILFVGESHYFKGEEIPRLFVREDVIIKREIKREGQYLNIFANLRKSLFRTNKINIETFWSLVAFYNLVQQPMQSIKQRPTSENFIEGSKVFVSVVEVIRPRTCIIIGLSSFNYIKDALGHLGFKSNEFKREVKIGKSLAGYAELEKENYKVQLIFIKHTSSYFSWRKWNEYLVKKIDPQINWLFEKVKL